MGLFYLLCRLIMMAIGTLYPVFLSYKAIKSNDLHLLETLLMYWVVMATVSAAEGTVEWTVSWIPFYYEIKTLIIIWLTLPQIQGSTWVYVTYIHPFLLEHEQDIDATLVRVKERLKAAGMGYIKAGMDRLKEVVMGSVMQNATVTTDEAAANDDQQERARPAPPGYAVQLLRQYGPAAFAATSALLRPMEGRGSVPAPPPDAALPQEAPTGTSTGMRHASTQEQVAGFVLREMRRRQAAPADSVSLEARRPMSAGFEEIQRDEATETEASPEPREAVARWWSWGRSEPVQQPQN